MEIQSEKIDKLVEALINARKDMDGAVKNGKGNWGAYASLEDLLECCMAPLLYNGIILTQPTIFLDGENQVVTQLTHVSGQFMRSSIAITVVKENDPQKALAGQTYARRGGIETILSIPRVDCDGDSLMPSKRPQKSKVEKPAEVKTQSPTYITDEQRRLLQKHMGKCGFTIEGMKELLGCNGYSTSKDIPAEEFGNFKKLMTQLAAEGGGE